MLQGAVGAHVSSGSALVQSLRKWREYPHTYPVAVMTNSGCASSPNTKKEQQTVMIYIRVAALGLWRLVYGEAALLCTQATWSLGPYAHRGGFRTAR